MIGPISKSFDLISSEYGWDDEVILDKTLRRIRQITAGITLRQESARKERRLELSWQTRSIAMTIAAAGGNASEDIMKFASNLTIDNEEYEQFGNEQPKSIATSKIPVHATTQDQATQANFEAAADRNNFDMLALFGTNMERGKPGQ